MGPARDERRHFKELELASFVPPDITDPHLDRLLYQVFLVLKLNQRRLTGGHRTLLNLIEKRFPGLNLRNGILHGCRGDAESAEYDGAQVEVVDVNQNEEQMERNSESKETTPVQQILAEAFPTPSRKSSSANHLNGQAASPKRHSGAKLPTPFNFFSPLKVPVSSSSADVFATLDNHAHDPTGGVVEELMDDVPFRPHPVRAQVEDLHPKVPFVEVRSREEAFSARVKQLCMDNSLAMVRGFGKALGIDMRAFTTKTVLQMAGKDDLELREQWFMPTQTNVDQAGAKTWRFHSFKCRSDVRTYAEYQGLSFENVVGEATRLLLEMRKEEDEEEVSKKKKKLAKQALRDKIYFGTNVDFSGPRFQQQINELQKFPEFCRLTDENNFLSHLGYDLRGMNSAQFYMKIPGCRTPAHLENNSFCAVNLNAGPGDCEWFGVSYEYFPMMDAMCKERRIDFLNGSWWPCHEDLEKAGIPVYRFTQKAGDIVWVSGGCVHWVEAVGWCNNIAWNVGPAHVFQYKMNLISAEWNRHSHYQSLVPMQHLSWQIARHMRVADRELFELVRAVLLRSLAYGRQCLDFVQRHTALRVYRLPPGDLNYTSYCAKCTTEVYNVLFAKCPAGESLDMVYDTYCLRCSRHETGIEVWQAFGMDQLARTLDQFVLGGRADSPKLENSSTTSDESARDL